MIFRQLFDAESSTYSYLIGSRQGGEALLIDSVVEKVPLYLKLLDELGLKLLLAADTHLHADHVTGLGALQDATGCITLMGEQSQVDCLSRHFHHGEQIEFDGIQLDVIHTPGHTDDSYCFLLPDRVLTGDTLLIRGTGRTDFQNGDSQAQYDSLFNRLLQLPDETLVYPAHDYNGMTRSSIGEERHHNPRLQVASKEAYVQLMNSLELSDPRMMDVAVPANRACGRVY